MTLASDLAAYIFVGALLLLMAIPLIGSIFSLGKPKPAAQLPPVKSMYLITFHYKGHRQLRAMRHTVLVDSREFESWWDLRKNSIAIELFVRLYI